MRTQFIGNFRVDRVLENEGPFAALDFILPGVRSDLVNANADWLKPTFVDPTDGRAIMSFQAFLLRTPYLTILVDACVGNDKERLIRPNWHRQRHPFLERLGALGVAPEGVDFVFCTHLHADHVGWNTRLESGRWVPTFPKARYIFARREYGHWVNTHRQALARGDAPINLGSFADSVLPVVEAKRAVFVASDHAIEDGVFLEPAYGHTPGNCILHARDGAGHALFVGDVIHTPVQFAQPSQSSRFCENPLEAASVRVALCERYADAATRIFACHFPTPVAGRIRRHRNAFKFAF